MRILVLDGSRVLPTLVRRLAPRNVEIELVADFEHAEKVLEENPPSAVIADVSGAGLPWSRLKTLCERHVPPIPVLFESCIFRTPEGAGIGALSDSSAFISKPHSLEDLRVEIDRLVSLAGDLSDVGEGVGKPT